MSDGDHQKRPGDAPIIASGAPGVLGSAKPSPTGPRPMGFAQHLFIWTLVVLVGVLFGIGPSLREAFSFRTAKVKGYDVDETEAAKLQSIARRLQSIIDPSGRRTQFTLGGDLRGYAERIVFARHADHLGLEPAGEVLSKAVDDFLAKPLPGRPGTYRDALVEHWASHEGEVTQPEVERWVATDFAWRALFAQKVHEPAVATQPVGQIRRAFADQIVVEQAAITAKPFAKDIADDDADLPRTYEELRASPDPAISARFVKPAVAVTTVAYADLAALMAQVDVSPAQIEAFYNANPHRWLEPEKLDEPKTDPGKTDSATPETPKSAPARKPLAAVEAEIRDELKKQAAQTKAQELVGAFVEQSEENEFADNATFSAAATQAGLTLTTVEISEPKERQSYDYATGRPTAVKILNAPGLGELKQDERQIGLFSKPVGFVSGAVETADTPEHPCTWLVLRLAERRDRQPRDRNEPDVLPFVKQHLAGRRAYGEFLVAAEALRAQAAAKGEGGLRAVLESDEGKKTWGSVTIEPRTLGATTEIAAPAKEVGGLAGESRPLISLAMPDHPVALGEGDDSTGYPGVVLMQVKDYKPAEPLPDAASERFVEAYRQQVSEYAGRQYYAALQREVLR